ncbi:MAG: tRNA (adenosine(37)-N6)-threonylcarbamoyltransferase complex ATPase subunit type 1 TsaE [Caldicoprobacterales bacterium]|jgi:tRNA threonylcarbamoyladenosine biosynthesis protein TsaE
MLIWLSRSEEDTYLFGKWIGSNTKAGDIILLFGQMGSGKTVLSRGIAHGAGVSGMVNSPTFTIMNSYSALHPVFHFDLYRLNEPEELYDLDYEDYFFGTGITIVEWAERLDYLLPEEYLKISISREQKVNERKITVCPVGSRYAAWKEVLQNYEGIGS